MIAPKKPEAWISANVETQFDVNDVLERDLVDDIDLFYPLSFKPKPEQNEENKQEIPY